MIRTERTYSHRITLISATAVAAWPLLSSCVYTPIKGQAGQRSIDAATADFWTGRLWLPAFSAYEEKAHTLQQAALLWEQKGEEALPALQMAFRQAMLALQDVTPYDQPIFANNFYTLQAIQSSFPLNQQALEHAVTQGWSASQLEQRLELGTLSPNALGYAALDYILFAPQVENRNRYAPIVQQITALMAKQAEEARAYHKEQVKQLREDTSFGPNGTPSVMLNALMRNLELTLRTPKIGIPIGVYGLMPHQPAPQTAEAVHSGLSTQLLHRAVKAVQDFYEGRPYGSEKAESAYGLVSILTTYLQDPRAAAHLVEAQAVLRQMEHELQTEKRTVDQLATTDEGRALLRSWYDAVQAQVALIKTDAVASLGITITYTDGEEGD